MLILAFALRVKTAIILNSGQNASLEQDGAVLQPISSLLSPGAIVPAARLFLFPVPQFLPCIFQYA